MAKTQKTKYAILGALTVRPMSGYDLKKWITNVTGPFWAESPGQIYPVLANMTEEGFISCEEQAQGKRYKKIYTITTIGRKILKEWLMQPAAITVSRNEFILKLFYGKNISKENCIKHLEHQLDLNKQKLEHYAEIEQHMKQEPKEDTFYWLLTLKGAIKITETQHEWCQETIEALKRK